MYELGSFYIFHFLLFQSSSPDRPDSSAAGKTCSCSRSYVHLIQKVLPLDVKQSCLFLLPLFSHQVQHVRHQTLDRLSDKIRPRFSREEPSPRGVQAWASTSCQGLHLHVFPCGSGRFKTSCASGDQALAGCPAQHPSEAQEQQQQQEPRYCHSLFIEPAYVFIEYNRT